MTVERVIELAHEGRIQAVIVKEPEFYSIKEVAKLLNVSYKTIYEEVACGRLASLKVGKSKRISRTQIDQYLNR